MSEDNKLPLYRCHKTVRACKIMSVIRYEDGSAAIVPLDLGLEDFAVPADYITKHNPQPGGYFVEYSDGYISFSPAEAFEQGYRLVEEDAQ